MSSNFGVASRTEAKQCTSFEHLWQNLGVEIAAEDVVRRYLQELMRTRFTTKTALATGMGTSRAQLQVSIREGRLTVDQMNALAVASGTSIWAVFREMSSIAEQLERGKLAKLTAEEIGEMLGGQGRAAETEERHVLPADADRLKFSGGGRGRRGDVPRGERRERAGRALPHPRSSDQPLKRSR